MSHSTTTAPHRIVVLGAGYAGMAAAVRVARRTRRLGAEVVLVNPTSRFAERLRMHQTAAGQQPADLRIPELVAGSGVEFVQGWATAIDAERQELTLTAPEGVRTLAYDTLVHALGSATDTDVVPGIEEHAFTLDGQDAAERLAARLAELDAAGGGTVTVSGSGLTGVEAAAEIAESHPALRVVLLGRERPGSMMGPKARAYLDAALVRLGVEVRSGVEVTKVLPDGIELADGELVHSDASLWTAGVRVSRLAAEAGIATDEHGRVLTEPSLRSTSHPAVWAVGDAAAVRQSYGVLHGTCQSGIPTGMHVADQIARVLRGGAPKPFRFGHIHQPVSLGRHDGVIQFTRGDDTPRAFCLTGARAVAYKEFVSGSPAKTYRMSVRFDVPTRMMWARGGRRNGR
ncbi:NAD(P)/FAD-dependent oxidoreductase [Streptacidiphilus jiangxiensis]|uniref:NADH dehydrogenase, FAD-containing subunit n=1 Tax=Streptacidiphilus jiangxiensis TaxID=235985 RepID=A0A1H7YP64_STRJI|nr:FAD-dependent oxidoreductase [Streptacidiphilus jiangxiensis]SEM46969.1 NADH dehydrogenase, FAD-containing subunit [Streptacidiphilus jiangxiensis]